MEQGKDRYDTRGEEREGVGMLDISEEDEKMRRFCKVQRIS